MYIYLLNIDCLIIVQWFLNKINIFRNKLKRPLVFNAPDNIDNLFLGIYSTKIYKEKKKIYIDKIKGIAYFDSGQKKFINAELGYKLRYNFKDFGLLYSLGSLNLSTNKPNFIFNDNISITYKNIGFEFIHFSDWFLTNHKEYDIPYTVSITF